ncbi:MAG: metallophosphoesterase [Bacteroidota bacterium]
MKTYQFIIFFFVVLLVYSAINYYIYHRAMQTLPADSGVKVWFKWMFIFVTGSYVVGRILERIQISALSNFLVWTGSFWLAVMFYSLLAVILFDIIRISNHFIGYLPLSWLTQKATLNLMGITMLLILSTVLAGYFNAINPKFKHLDLKIDKKANGIEELNIAMASDIHMGTIIGPRRMAKLVDSINMLKPDIILLAGDIVDEDLGPVIKQNLGEALRKLQAPMGVYGITGNHEYIGGAQAAVNYLQEHGIVMICDSVIKIADAFYIAGREDRDKPRFSGKARLQLEKLLKDTDKSLPIILMDHQPFDLQKAEAAGVDLQLSGHTHHGQIWPLNYLTKAIFEVSMGYKKKGNSHFYISPGFGGWGPPVRIGNRPEIVNIRLKFKTSDKSISSK